MYDPASECECELEDRRRAGRWTDGGETGDLGASGPSSEADDDGEGTEAAWVGSNTGGAGCPCGTGIGRAEELGQG